LISMELMATVEEELWELMEGLMEAKGRMMETIMEEKGILQIFRQYFSLESSLKQGLEARDTSLTLMVQVEEVVVESQLLVDLPLFQVNFREKDSEEVEDSILHPDFQDV